MSGRVRAPKVLHGVEILRRCRQKEDGERTLVDAGQRAELRDRPLLRLSGPPILMRIINVVTRAADATNLAVMADTDDASAEFARLLYREAGNVFTGGWSHCQSGYS